MGAASPQCRQKQNGSFSNGFSRTTPPPARATYFLERTILPPSAWVVRPRTQLLPLARPLVVRSWTSLSLEISRGPFTRPVRKGWEGKVSIKIQIPSSLQSWILEKVS